MFTCLRASCLNIMLNEASLLYDGDFSGTAYLLRASCLNIMLNEASLLYDGDFSGTAYFVVI